MKTLALAVALAVSAPAFAQVRVSVALPTISFPAPPRLVVVQPGVQVVEDYGEEVFFVDNYYWHHRGPYWYRTRLHTGGWELVEPRFVPRPIFGFAPGAYRHWHAPRHVAVPLRHRR